MRVPLGAIILQRIRIPPILRQHQAVLFDMALDPQLLPLRRLDLDRVLGVGSVPRPDVRPVVVIADGLRWRGRVQVVDGEFVGLACGERGGVGGWGKD